MGWMDGWMDGSPGGPRYRAPTVLIRLYKTTCCKDFPASCFLNCNVVVRINFVVSNCEIVYSDADLPTADAVVFHLHKVLLLI